MRKYFLALVFLAVSSLLAAQQALNNDAIVKMVKAGFSDDLIITTVNGAPGTYDTSVDGLIALKNAGVSEKVVAAIVAKASAPVTAPASTTAPVAADPNDPTSPHDPGIYMMLHDAAGKPKMVRLEQKESDTLPSFTGSAIVAKIPGAQAEQRFSESKPLFYLYFPSNSGITDSANPSQFTLVWLNRKKDHREIEVGHRKTAGAFTGMGAGYVYVTEIKKDNVIPASAEKLRANVYRVTPDNELGPGEYALIATMKLNETGSASFFDFGYDPR